MQTSTTPTTERRIEPQSGWPVLIAWFIGVLAVVLSLAFAPVPLKITAVFGIPVLVILLCGFYIVNPNMARVLVLFGHYVGSVERDGFFWTNPFTIKHKLSLRARNLDGDKLKVNDLLGNPIEISIVLVWRVANTARAMFDVDDYEHYVRVQSDAALRQVASAYPYDDGLSSDMSTTLRGSKDEISNELVGQLSDRLESAGIQVIEARLNHLAYATEIASAMLQRQQASAIIAARSKIVEGAVGMVEMALEQLGEKGVLELDEERRATLVGNLLVVLCGQANPQPVLNTGSLYN